MFAKLFSRSSFEDVALKLYGQIVAQSRSVAFYRDRGVPDTFEGRFELILLHQVLVFRRLERLGDDGKTCAQAVFDTFLADMDESMREMGVGDLSIPKKMKRLTGAYLGRVKVYGGALEADDVPALAGALARNALGTATVGEQEIALHSQWLADYAVQSERHLAGLTDAALLTGTVTWPDADTLEGTDG